MDTFTNRSPDTANREVNRDLDRLEKYFRIKECEIRKRSTTKKHLTVEGFIEARFPDGSIHKNTFSVPFSSDGCDDPLENTVIESFYPDLKELVPA